MSHFFVFPCQAMYLARSAAEKGATWAQWALNLLLTEKHVGPRARSIVSQVLASVYPIPQHIAFIMDGTILFFQLLFIRISMAKAGLG